MFEVPSQLNNVEKLMVLHPVEEKALSEVLEYTVVTASISPAVKSV
jgi:hypothetical protein